MVIIKKFTCFFILFIFIQSICASASESVDVKPQVYKAFQHIYNFEFQRADSIRQKLVKTNPFSPFTYLLNANYYWWQIIAGDDSPSNVSTYNSIVANAVSLVNSRKNTSLSDEEAFVFINLFAFRVRLELLHYKIFSAVSKLDDCIDYFKMSLGNESRYAPFYLTSGLYNYFVSYANDNYPIVSPLFLFYPKGDVVKGISQLNTASQSKDIILNAEGNYFLMKIYFEQRKNNLIAKSYSNNLVVKYPNNLLYQYFYMSILKKSGDKTNALVQKKLLTQRAQSNPQISLKQKNYFINMASKEVK